MICTLMFCAAAAGAVAAAVVMAVRDARCVDPRGRQPEDRPDYWLGVAYETRAYDDDPPLAHALWDVHEFARQYGRLDIELVEQNQHRCPELFLLMRDVRCYRLAIWEQPAAAMRLSRRAMLLRGGPHGLVRWLWVTVWYPLSSQEGLTS